MTGHVAPRCKVTSTEGDCGGTTLTHSETVTPGGPHCPRFWDLSAYTHEAAENREVLQGAACLLLREVI